MSARSSIIKALVEELKKLDGTTYTSNVYENVKDRLVFWDEINDFPYICVSPSSETREYHPGGFKWGFLSVNIRVYVKGEDPVSLLEPLLEDIELVIDNSQQVEYSTGKTTTEILINSILTDEGVLDPLGVGDISLIVRYEIT